MPNPKGTAENLKPFEGKWKHGQTRTIRVPITLADQVLTMARKLDNGESLDTGDKALWLKLQDSRREAAELRLRLTEALGLDHVEPADLLNRLKAKNRKSKATLADIETILELLES